MDGPCRVTPAKPASIFYIPKKMRLTNELQIKIILMAGWGSSRMVARNFNRKHGTRTNVIYKHMHMLVMAYHQHHYKQNFNCPNACSSAVENTYQYMYSKQWYLYRAQYINKNLSNIECLFFLCIKTYGPSFRTNLVCNSKSKECSAN